MSLDRDCALKEDKSLQWEDYTPQLEKAHAQWQRPRAAKNKIGSINLKKEEESPLDCKEIKPVYPKGNQSWIFTGRTDAEAEAPVLWPPDVKNWLTRKDPDAGKDWRHEEKGMTPDEMDGWHHQLGAHEFEQALGFGDPKSQDREAWHAAVHGVSKSQTQLSDWTELNRWCLFWLMVLLNLGGKVCACVYKVLYYVVVHIYSIISYYGLPG